MELGGIQNQHPQKKNSLDTKVRSFLENSCSILSFFKLVMIFNNTSADFVLISADVLLKIITILKELRIKVINVGSDTFGNPIFQKGLQN